MASPYFSQINVNRADYSPLVRAGSTIGQMYADMGRQIGQALGDAGSKYFENKKIERAFADYIKTPEGTQWALERGTSPFEIQEWKEDPKKIDKAVMKMVKDVGVDKLRESFRDRQTLKMAEEQRNQATNLYKLTLKDKELAIEEKNRALRSKQYGLDYQQHLMQKGADGRYLRDTLDPTEGFDLMGEDGKVDSEKLDAVMQINKSMNLGRYSPQMVSAVFDSFRRNDVGGDGKLLPQVNFLSEASFQQRINEMFADPRFANLPPESLAQAKERLRKTIVPKGGVREIIDNAVERNGFGAFAEQAKTQIGTMGRFTSLLDEATVMTEEGLAVKNPVAASVVLMQMARMAQGVGVLSNQDVALIAGSKTAEAQYQRFIEKVLGDKITLTKEMMENNPAWAGSTNPDTNKRYEVGDDVLVGGANLSAADLKMFKDIATELDSRFKQMVDVSIPQIYEEVRGIYGGLTTEEIHSQSDLDVFYPDGFRSAATKQMQIDGVPESNIASAVNAYDSGLSRTAIEKKLRSSPQFDASVGDEEVLKMTLNAAEERIARREKLQDSAAKDRDTYNRLYPDVEGYQPPLLNSNKQVQKPSNLDNLQDGGTGASATGLGTGFVAGSYGGKMVADRIIDQPKASNLGEIIFERKAQKIKTGSFQELKDIAKKQNIDTNKFRGNEAGLRKELDKRLKKEVAAKLKGWATKKGMSTIVKKGIVSLLGGAMTGGVGLVAGSLLYDIIALAENDSQARLETFEDMLSKARTEEERDMIKSMKATYVANLKRNKPRFESGVYKGIGSYGFGG